MKLKRAIPIYDLLLISEGSPQELVHKLHGLIVLFCLDEFISIPCHWDGEHAIETAKDIVNVLLRLQIDSFRVIHSY